MVSTDIDWLQEGHDWPGLAAIGKMFRVCETADKTTSETAYYLLSSAMTPQSISVRSFARIGASRTGCTGGWT